MVKTAFGDVKAFPNGSIALKGHPFNGHPYLVNVVTTLKFCVYMLAHVKDCNELSNTHTTVYYLEVFLIHCFVYMIFSMYYIIHWLYCTYFDVLILFLQKTSQSLVYSRYMICCCINDRHRQRSQKLNNQINLQLNGSLVIIKVVVKLRFNYICSK